MSVVKTRVIFLTLGPLHLLRSAVSLLPYADVRVVQGWLPAWWNRWLLAPLSRIVGYDLRRTFVKREPEQLQGHNVGIALPDWFDNIVRRFVRNPSRLDHLSTLANRMFGRMARRYLCDVDVLHVRSGSGLGGAIEHARDKGAKIVVDHSIAHPHFMERQLRPEYERNGQWFGLGEQTEFWQAVLSDCAKADVLLVNSEFVRDTFIEAGYTPLRIRIAYLGVRGDFMRLKTDYSLTGGKLRILFTGGFGFRKGAEYILLALKSLEEQGIDYEFTVVGSNGEALGLLKSISPSHARLVGTVPQDDLKKFLASSDLYLFPSLCEGCASSAMEALAAGLPVVATRESGLPIVDGETGLLVASKDAGAIAQALLRLRADEALRARLGRAAAKLVADNYTWDDYARRVANVYGEL